VNVGTKRGGNMTRTRLRVDRFSIIPPDINHDCWDFIFTDESMKNDVIIEMEDMDKFMEKLSSFKHKKRQE